ncbi:MAG TPA: hypothetical protein VH601_20445 [Bryobacteraceae bacterium]|jgi:hypothetical protein
MTNFSSHSLSTPDYVTVVWHDSETIPGVRFGTRRVSLAGRIELLKRVRELTLRYEFLKAGDSAEQAEASLSELLVQQLLLGWGLMEVNGLTIDGQPATRTSLIESGPEVLSDEIAEAVRREIGLSEEERKNF